MPIPNLAPNARISRALPSRVIGIFNGESSDPIVLVLNNSGAWVLDLQNQDAAVGPILRAVRPEDATVVLFQLDKNGLRASPDGTAAAVIATLAGAQTWQNKTFDATSNVWVRISQATVDVQVNSLAFVSIPTAYRHLMVLWSARSSDTTGGNFETGLAMQLNGVGSGSYDYEQVVIVGGSRNEAFLDDQGYFVLPDVLPTANSPASGFGAGRIVLGGSSRVGFKTVQVMAFARTEAAVARLVLLGGGLGIDDAGPITSISFTPASGQLAVGSQFTLLGRP